MIVHKKWNKWISKTFIALLDQGVFSSANFLLNVLLARWMTEKDFGMYSVSYTVFLLLSVFHNAIILEPASVIGPSRYQQNLGEYIIATSKAHFLVTTPIALLFLATGLVFRVFGLSSEISDVLISLGFSFPIILYLWWFRRACYLQNNPFAAFWTSVSYSVLLCAGIIFLYNTGKVSLMPTYLLFSVVSLLSTLPVTWRQKLQTSSQNISLKKILQDDWNFGKWVMIGGLFYIGAGQIQTFFVAAIAGFEGAAVLRAMSNFFLPMALTVTAVSTLALPILSRDYGNQDYKSLIRKGILMTTLLSGACIAYIIGIAFGIQPLEMILYAGKYADYVRIGLILSFIPFLTALSSGFSLILRSMQKVNTYIYVNASAFFVGIPSAWFFTLWWGVDGAAFSLVLSYVVSTLVTIGIFLKIYLDSRGIYEKFAK